MTSKGRPTVQGDLIPADVTLDWLRQRSEESPHGYTLVMLLSAAQLFCLVQDPAFGAGLSKESGAVHPRYLGKWMNISIFIGDENDYEDLATSLMGRRQAS